MTQARLNGGTMAKRTAGFPEDDDVFRRVALVISDYTGIEVQKITPEFLLMDIPDLDSFVAISVVSLLEGEFTVTIPDEDLKKIMAYSVEQLAEYVKEKVRDNQR